MAVPKDSEEQAFRLRRFEGTNTEIDSVFLGPSVVSRSENWVPTQSYRLGKRPGTTLMQQPTATIPAMTDITDLFAVRSESGQLCLYAYCRRPAVPDAIVASSLDEAPFTITAFTFASPTAVGRMVQFRNRIYCGNGVDPIKSWVIGTTTGFEEYGVITDLGVPPVATVAVVAAGNTPLPDGTYSYTWAVYNTTTKFYTARYQAAQVVVPVQSSATFPLPAAAPAGHVLRLFVAYRGFPIEYATMQADAPPVAVTLTTVDVNETRCPLVGITRTGTMLLVWRNRVVFAGQASDPYSIFATDTILPGLEQAVFNQGTFFPTNAKVRLPRKVTGICIAGVTSDQEAQAPLVFFTLSKTFLCMGDPFSKIEEATLIELSSRIGCISHDSIVNTPDGPIFCGLDSVYYIPPGGGYPVDIGWPIADQIRAIPPGQREKVHGVFHKQFYKLTISIPGGIPCAQSWWLDLRQGLTETPSWWGPMTMRSNADPPVLLGLGPQTTDIESIDEVDRGYGVLLSNQAVLRLHQTSTYTDYLSGIPPTVITNPIQSTLRTGRFDAGAPFDMKVFTRLRLIAQTSVRSSIAVNFQTDGGDTWAVDRIELGLSGTPAGQFVRKAEGAPIAVPPGPPTWKSWNRIVRDPTTGQITLQTTGNATFGSISPVEVQTITPAIRPRGLSAVVTLTHDPVTQLHDDADPRRGVGNVELRDFELLCLISGRKVRYVGERAGK
jgi:hypothetical protein